MTELRESSRTSVALIVSGVLTVLNLINKLGSVISESNALKEETLVYLMSKQTANSKWIPYQQLMVDHKLKKCIDFGKIKIQQPANLSKVTGFYKSIKFEFSDVTVKAFVFDLNNWVKTASKVELMEMQRVKLKFELPE